MYELKNTPEPVRRSTIEKLIVLNNNLYIDNTKTIHFIDEKRKNRLLSSMDKISELRYRCDVLNIINQFDYNLFIVVYDTVVCIPTKDFNIIIPELIVKYKELSADKSNSHYKYLKSLKMMIRELKKTQIKFNSKGQK